MNIDLIVPRRLGERKEHYKRIIYKKIQEYIKNGSVGSLWLSESPIETLPSNLKTVDGDLHLQFSKILELPEGLTVNGSLYLHYSHINRLPSGLTVNGSLYLHYTHINRLPSGLKVSGSLYIKHTPLSENYTLLELWNIVQNLGGDIKGDIRM